MEGANSGHISHLGARCHSSVLVNFKRDDLTSRERTLAPARACPPPPGWVRKYGRAIWTTVDALASPKRTRSAERQQSPLHTRYVGLVTPAQPRGPQQASFSGSPRRRAHARPRPFSSLPLGQRTCGFATAKALVKSPGSAARLRSPHGEFAIRTDCRSPLTTWGTSGLGYRRNGFTV